MANKFCPNFSIPAIKARYDELGPIPFYKEYIRNNYQVSEQYLNIDENTSIQDMLAVNRELFDAHQQDSIRDSIIYQIQDIRNYDSSLTVSQIKDVVRANMEIDRDDFLSEQDEESQQLATNINNVLNHYDRFWELAEDKLASLGTKQTPVTSIQLDNEVDETESAYESEEGINQKLNYSDESNFAQSSKDTASAHMKTLLSLIPKYEYEDGKIVVDEDGKYVEDLNMIGYPVFEDLDSIWNDLLYTLVNVPRGEKLNTLRDSDNPKHNIIYEKIVSDPNTKYQNEFEVVFSKQQAKFITGIIRRPTYRQYYDKETNTWETVVDQFTGFPILEGRSISIIDTNRNQPENLIVADWYNNFLSSKLVKDVNGNLTVDTDNGKKIRDIYNKALAEWDIPLLSKVFRNIGIELSEKALESEGIYVDRQLTSPKDLLQQNGKFIFNRLAGEVNDSTETQLDEDNSLEANNPFMTETRPIDLLAKLENKVNPSIFESSFISGDNKAKYSFVNNTYATHQVRKLTDDRGYLNKLKSTEYAKHSHWLNQLINNPTFKQHFDFRYVDTLGNDSNNQTNKSFRDMNTKEKEYFRVSSFQNGGQQVSRDKNSDFVSYFIGLTPSDKTTLPVFKALSINTQSTQDTIDVLYDQFVSEYNRVKLTIAQNGDPNIVPIDKYHGKNGMGSKFILFPMFNKILFDSGVLLELDDTRINTLVRPQLEKLISDLTKEQIDYWTSLGIYNEGLFDKTYKRKKGITDANMIEGLEALAKSYSVNYFVALMNQTQLFSGDPALHGKPVERDGDFLIGDSIENTWINYFKRMAKDIAPGLDPNFEDDNFNTIFLKDIKYESKHLSEYRKVIGDKVDQKGSYGDINPADAQEYTTLDEHLTVLKALGRVGDDVEAAVQRLKEGGSDINDIELVLQPMKPVYVEGVVEDGINKMYYIKTSSFPLIPALTKGLEIDKLRVLMEDSNNNIQRAVYESGVKLGMQGDILNVGKSFDNLSISPKQIINLPRTGFRIQQEIPFHGEDTTINEGSQGRKLILNNLSDSDVIDYNGKKVTGREAKEIFEKLHIEKMNRAFDQLKEDLGVDNYGRITNLDNLAEILRQEAKDRNYPLNDIYSVQVIEENGVKKFKIPLNFTQNATRFESILNSLITNRVIKSELPGFSKVQGAGVGFTKVVGSERLEEFESEILWVNPNDTELNYIREEDGKLVAADILVPNYLRGAREAEIRQLESEIKKETLRIEELPSTATITKDNRYARIRNLERQIAEVQQKDDLVDISQYIKEDGTLDTDRIPESVLTIIGVRIPTQGYNSMMKFRVKGFLPRYMGDLAIVPAEITSQMGSDFDVDKMFIYNYHHRVDKDGNIKKITTDFEITSKTSALTRDKVNEIYRSQFQNYTRERADEMELLSSNLYDPNVEESFIRHSLERIANGTDTNIQSTEILNPELADDQRRAAASILKKIEYGELNLGTVEKADIDYSKLSGKQLDNLIIQMFEDRLSDPNIFADILEPNGFGKLPEVAEEVAKLTEAVDGIHTLTSKTQNNIYNINADGKMGTALFSLASTFFKAAQDAKLSINTPLRFKKESGEVVELNNLFEINNIEGNKRSNVIMYLQSAAVDNSKEQILGKLNINDQTMNVASVMAMLGLPEDFIGYFMSQPIIKEYVAEMQNSADIIDGGSFDPNLSLNTINNLAERVGAGLSSDRQINLLSTIDLRNQLSNQTNDAQFDIINTFSALKSIADEIQVMQSAINPDTKGLGSSWAGLEAKYIQLARVERSINKNSEALLSQEGRKNLIYGDTQIAKSIQVMKDARNMFSNVNVYTGAVYDEIINPLLESVDLSPSEANMKDVYNNLKSYILSASNFINSDDINLIRDSLLYGKDNIAERWQQYSNTPEGKRNILTKRIKARIARNNEDFNGLTANNTPASSNAADINNATMYFYDMINSDNQSERKLAEDMVRYFLLTGAQFGPSSIGKYITYDILERYGFSSKLRDLETKLKAGNTNLLTSFEEQYFQNNPFKAKSVELTKFEDTLEISPFDLGDTIPKYIVTYDKKTRSPKLYKLIGTSENDNAVYSILPVLGNKQLKKYDFNAEPRYITPKTKSQENVPTVAESINSDTRESNATLITDKYNFNNGSINDVLSRIVETSQVPEFKDLASKLVNSSGISNLNLTVSDDVNSNGSYTPSTNTVAINLDRIGTFTNYYDKFEQVFLEELIHGLTISALNNTDNAGLSSQQITAKNKINRLYKEYIDNFVDKKQLERFRGIMNTAPEARTAEDIAFARAHLNDLYPLTSVAEFVGQGLTKPEFREVLKGNNFWTRLIDLIKTVLGLNNQTDLDFLFSNTLDLITVEETSVDNRVPRYYTGNIKPEPNTIFVFGSNPEGRHGGGNAKIARTKFGIKNKEFKSNNAFGLITKDLMGYANFDKSILKVTPFGQVYYESEGATFWKDKIDYKGKRYEKIDDGTATTGTIPKGLIRKGSQFERASEGGKWLHKLPADFIAVKIAELYEEARNNPNKDYKIAYNTDVTKQSLNGYTGLEMIEMFNQAGAIPSNVIFSKEWVDTGLFNERQPPQEGDQLSLFNIDGPNEFNIDEYNRLQFVEQRDKFFKNWNVKDYFNNQFKKYTAESQKKFLTANGRPGYERLKIWFFDNQLRVSRVDPVIEPKETYFNMDEAIPKSREDKYIDRILNKYDNTVKEYENRLKLTSNEGERATLLLELEKLKARLEELRTDRSVIKIVDSVERRLNKITQLLESDNVNHTELSDSFDYLKEFILINQEIDFDTGSEIGKKYSQKADRIAGESAKMISRIKDKMAETVQSWANSEVDWAIAPGIKKILTHGIEEVGSLESGNLDPTQSSSPHIQAIQYLIDHSQDRANEEHSEFMEELLERDSEYRSKYKSNFSQLYQLDEDGKPTQFLLNKYKDDFYKKSRGDFDFWRKNVTFEITKENRDAYQLGKESIKDSRTDEEYLEWIKEYDPEQWIKDIKAGIKRRPNPYVTDIPTNEWIDPRYTQLISKGEDDPAVKYYRFIEPLFRKLNRKYRNQVNYVPELQKDAKKYFMEGNMKGGLSKVYDNLAGDLQGDIYIGNTGDIDTFTGNSRLRIPTRFFDNKLDNVDRSTDLSRIAELVMFQEISNKVKHEVEPLLKMYYALLKDAKQNKGTDEDGNPILIDKGASRVSEQAEFMINGWLYGLYRSTEDSEQKYGKHVDALINYVRLKGMGYNPFSAIGNIAQGLMSNITFAAGNQYFGQKDFFKATGLMLNTLAGNTKNAKKISQAFIFTDAFVKHNEMNFGMSRELQTARSKFSDLSNAFILQQMGEYFVQGQTMLAVLHKQKVKNLKGESKSLWEAFDDNFKWKTDEFGENPYKDSKVKSKLKARVRKAIVDVHGNYARPIQNKKHFYWRLVYTFRTWLPQAITNRFGGETTDILLGDTTKGRYRSLPRMWKDSNGTLDWGALRDNVLWLVKLGSKNSLSEVDQTNMRKNLSELILLSVITSTILLLRAGFDDWDDDEKELYTYVYNNLTRAQTDLLFFMNPSAMDTILKDPVAATSVIRDLMDVTEAGWDTISGNPTYKTGHRKGQLRLVKEFIDNVPIANQVPKNIGYMQQVFDRR